MKKYIHILTTLFFLTFVSAQELKLEGEILDSSNKSPLAFANIILEGTSLGAASDNEGRFIIERIKAGTYTVIASYMGYSVYKKKIIIPYTLDSGKLLILLEPETIQLDEYVVTASRRRERIEDAPAAISVISKTEIRRESNTNLGDYLKGTKGIDFTQSGIDSYNMTARGFNSSFSSRLLTLTDGRMANVPSLRLTAYNVIPVSFDDVEQIEVVLGPSSALYGPNAHSGVLNIVTSSPLRSQGTKFNFQHGYLNQNNTDPLKKYTMRTAHKYNNIGIKISAVALTGEDWRHINPDEYEGHSPAFIGRYDLQKNRINDGGNAAELGSPRLPISWLENEIPNNGIDDNGNGFIDEDLNWGNYSGDVWEGPEIADGVDNFFFIDGENGSPTVDSAMILQAQGDPYNRYFLDNGIILYDLDYSDLGKRYIDGIDNDGDGEVDEGIDKGIDENVERWIDGIDNDGDGEIDEADEIGDVWLDRIESKYGTWNLPNGGFGDYEFDEEGNLIFDSNRNGTFNDDWGRDGIDNDGDNDIDELGEGDFVVNYGDLPRIVKDSNNDGIDDYPDFNVKNLRYDFRLDWEPNSDFTASLSHGYAWAKNVNITGIARYLADGWVYRYYQSKIRYKNLFLQTYLNSSFSGEADHPTRNLATGSIIYDRSKKFSLQLQHYIERMNGDFRFVWGLDYFLTLPDTRGTILADKDGTDLRDNNGNGEAGSANHYFDRDDSFYFETGESLRSIDSSGQMSSYDPTTIWGSDFPYSGVSLGDDNVNNAVKDGLDNDGDSDDFDDLDGNGLPFTDNNGNGLYDPGVDQVEPGARAIKGTHVFVFADGIDNDGDGKIDENIDEGIDEKAEDNRYKVNEFGMYYQLNWKINDKLEFIQATRFDIHDRLTDIIQFNNQNTDASYSPFNWDFDLSKTEGVQFSPKFGLAYKPKENQNYRLTWAKAFNTPSNQALFLDIFVTRLSVFKIFARGADGGYQYTRNNRNENMWYDPYGGTYQPVDSSLVYFYPSIDPKIAGYFSGKLQDQPELESEIVSTWEFGYKGRLRSNIFGTFDLYKSHYSSFVSGATFITPLMLEKSILTDDHNNNGISNYTDLNGDVIIDDQDDYDNSLDIWRQGIEGVVALADTAAGVPTPVVIGYVNYGEVDVWGFDGSLAIFLSRTWNMDVTYSYMGTTDFFNPITKAKESINSPKHKAGLKLQYSSNKIPATLSLNGRYVDGYKWSSGIYFGDIKAYTIFDLHLGYEVNKHIKANLTVNNIFNNKHIEIIGGPSLGQIIMLRLETKL
ncbi:MAG: TonB-dependent receptor domain-containing protein [Candidatus Neomarinimicrobiota bacterium]